MPDVFIESTSLAVLYPTFGVTGISLRRTYVPVTAALAAAILLIGLAVSHTATGWAAAVLVGLLMVAPIANMVVIAHDGI